MPGDAEPACNFGLRVVHPPDDLGELRVLLRRCGDRSGGTDSFSFRSALRALQARLLRGAARLQGEQLSVHVCDDYRGDIGAEHGSSFSEVQTTKCLCQSEKFRWDPEGQRFINTKDGYILVADYASQLQ